MCATPLDNNNPNKGVSSSAHQEGTPSPPQTHPATSIMMSTPTITKPDPQPKLPDDYKPQHSQHKVKTLPAATVGTPAKASRVVGNRLATVQGMYHLRHMKSLERTIQREQKLRNAQVPLPNVTRTMNPVSKLQANAFVPKSSLGGVNLMSRISTSDLQKTKEMIDKALRFAMTDPSVDEKQRNALLNDWNRGGHIFKLYRHYVDPNTNPDDLLIPKPSDTQLEKKDMMTSLIKYFDGMEAKGKKYTLNREAYQLFAVFHSKLREAVENELQNSQGISDYYQKDELLSNLDLAKSREGSPHAAIDKLMQAIYGQPGLHISSDDLKRLADHDKALIQAATRNLTVYVSTAEATFHLQYNEEVASSLKKDPNYQRMDMPSYAVKEGLENNREILATSLNDITHTNKFLLPKRPMTLEGAHFGGKDKPVVIYTPWLEGGKIDYKEWSRYFNYKAPLIKYERNGVHSPEQAHDKENVENVVAREKTRMMGLVSEESVQAQAYNDLDLMSFDSHTEQYVIVDGHAYCYDFSRFLPPSDVVQNTITGETTGVLRSCFLDHPYAETEITSALKNTILSQDMNAIEQEARARGLIGDPTKFDRAEADLVQCQADYERLDFRNLAADDIVEMAAYYGVDAGSSTIIADLKTAIKAKKLEVQQETTKYIDPKAFAGWKERKLKQQEYLRQTKQHPTLRGMRDHVFPDFVPFYRALDTLEGASSQNLGIKMLPGGANYRSFEGIIEDAKAGNFPVEEIQQMEEALTRMKARALPGVRLSLSMKL